MRSKCLNFGEENKSTESLEIMDYDLLLSELRIEYDSELFYSNTVPTGTG